MQPERFYEVTQNLGMQSLLHYLRRTHIAPIPGPFREKRSLPFISPVGGGDKQKLSKSTEGLDIRRLRPLPTGPTL